MNINLHIGTILLSHVNQEMHLDRNTYINTYNIYQDSIPSTIHGPLRLVNSDL